MTIKNPMQLKAFIKKKSKESGISAQLIMQNYMMERLLERISLTDYKNNFILKGGFLIAAIVGLDTRATMDMDATLKDYPLNNETMRNAFVDICAIDVDDDISFTVLRITNIRDDDIYSGLRVYMKAEYKPISVPFTVDITTGDVITPREIEYSYNLMFDNRTLSVLAYNIETILAEKLETVLSRNIANTRPRDFYDIHVLYALRASECDLPTLKQALSKTAERRGSSYIFEQYVKIITDMRNNDQMFRFWESYRKDFNYAKSIEFSDTCNSISMIMDHVMKA